MYIWFSSRETFKVPLEQNKFFYPYWLDLEPTNKHNIIKDCIFYRQDTSLRAKTIIIVCNKKLLFMHNLY